MEENIEYRVRVLKMGQCDCRGPEVYWMSHWDEWETLYFWMVLIQGGGHTVLVNTGPPRELTDLNRFWGEALGPRGEMVRKEEERPEAALASVGVRPEDVDHVLITPLQSYAAGNIPLFSKATICISRKGWIEDFHAPRSPMHVPRKIRLPDDVLYYLDIAAPEKLRLLEDEEKVLPGLDGFWAGTHHRSSMAYVVSTAKGRVVVSDAFFKYGNIEKELPLGIAESLEEGARCYARVRRTADIVLPLYDPEVLERFPGGVVV